MLDELKVKLLGRIAFGPNPERTVRNIITYKKRGGGEAYIQGYNALNGKRTLTKVAQIIGVNRGTLSPILRDWENIGIIYKVGKNYKKIFPIPWLPFIKKKRGSE